MKSQYKNRTVNRDFVAMPEKPKKASIALHSVDCYDERANGGTAFAELVLAWQNPNAGGVMPVPPRRRSA